MRKESVSTDESVENVGSHRWGGVITSYNTTMPHLVLEFEKVVKKEVANELDEKFTLKHSQLVEYHSNESNTYLMIRGSLGGMWKL